MFPPVDVSGDISLAVEEKMRPRVMRKLGITPPWDGAVDSMPLPRKITMTTVAVRMCRIYRRLRPASLGDRCAFEPSCSRYSELAFRIFGFRRGVKETFRRLRRCSAQNGGLDLPPTIESLDSLTERNMQ